MLVRQYFLNDALRKGKDIASSMLQILYLTLEIIFIRLESLKTTTFLVRCDPVSAPEPQRVRAFSVGSRGPKVRPHLTPSRHSSHSSVEPSEDLMEMDFSRNSKTRGRHKTTFKKPSTSVSSERLTLPSASGVSSAASSYSTAEGSYMEMSPRYFMY